MSAALRNVLTGIIRNAPIRVGSKRWFRNRTGHASGCVICGAELPRMKPGRPHVHGNRKTCSSKCRQKAYRLRGAVTNNHHGNAEGNAE